MSEEATYRPGDVVNGHRLSEDGTRWVPVDEGLEFTRYEVFGLESIQHLLPDPCCGIYVLHFTDGSQYVGQSIDVALRFSGHRRTWPDVIVAVDYAACPEELLDDAERDQIHLRERAGQTLRNTVHMSHVTGKEDIPDPALAVPESDWVRGRPCPPIQRDPDPALRAKGAKAYDRFLHDPMVDDDRIVKALAFYLDVCVPCPAAAEQQKFLSITAAPSTGRSKTWRRLAAVSVHSMETLVIGVWSDGQQEWIGGFLNMSRDTLAEETPIEELPADPDEDHWYYYIRGSERPYEDAGYDQIRIDFFEIQGLVQVLVKVPGVAWACRELVQRLVRKGRSMQARWHNYLLADDVFAEMDRASESGES